jgi:hypothetical protein
MQEKEGSPFSPSCVLYYMFETSRTKAKKKTTRIAIREDTCPLNLTHNDSYKLKGVEHNSMFPIHKCWRNNGESISSDCVCI